MDAFGDADFGVVRMHLQLGIKLSFFKYVYSQIVLLCW